MMTFTDYIWTIAKGLGGLIVVLFLLMILIGMIMQMFKGDR